jgi:osmotically-inducible protein OsmY
MKTHLLVTAGWLVIVAGPIASIQAQNNTGSLSPTTGNSLTAGSTSLGGGEAGAAGLQGIESGKAVEIRTGFLNPIDKAGFLMPSNTTTTARSSRSTSTSRVTTPSSRSTGLSSLRGLGGFGGRGLGSQFGSSAQSGANAGAQTLRFPMRMATTTGTTGPIPIQAAVMTRFQERVTNLPGFDSASGVRMAVEGRTAVLRGTVATDRQREMLTRLAMLEPGVSTVRNELTVDGSSSPPESLPPSTPKPAAP